MNEILFNKKFLVITAHPDDEAFVFAGLMQKIVDSGGAVFLYCASHGERGKAYLQNSATEEELAEMRGKELAEVMEIIGVTRYLCDNFPDGSIADHAEAVATAAGNFFREVQPDMLIGFGPEGFTLHRDHIAMHHVAVKLSQERNLPLLVGALPPPPYRDEFIRSLGAKRKNSWYDISAEEVAHEISIKIDGNKKMECLKMHATQFPGLDPYKVFPKALAEHFLSTEYYFYQK